MLQRARIPSVEDYLAFDGGHCYRLWRQLDDSWRCPACNRTKYELIHWTTRHFKLGVGKCPPYEGWMAALHKHHDHSQGYFHRGTGRFPEAIICGQCNTADGIAKRRLVLPVAFSFSAAEIGLFITAVPHATHPIDLDKAWEIYSQVNSVYGYG